MSKLQKLKKITKKVQGNNGQKEDKDSTPIIRDERFKAVHFDPKFASLSKKNQKIKVDNRFKGMFKDQRFKVVNKVDKYGREIEVPQTNKEMEDFYYVDEEDQEDEDGEEALDGQEDEEEEEEVPSKKNNKNGVINHNEGKNKKNKNRFDNKTQNNETAQNGERPKIAHFNEEGRFEWNEVSSESDFDEVDIQQQLEGEAEKLWDTDESEEDAPEGKPSKRLALVKYDWANISAQDVMLFLSSFVPKNGFIKSVTVYPSDFGLQKMKEEEVQGPTDIWRTQREAKNEKEKALLEKTILDADQPWIFAENENEDIDPVKLRKYERDRLKYYYAVIECDSKATAKAIVDECNGLEFELTSIKINLQYVPDDLVFPHPPKEVCTELPATSKVHNFLNRAVTHTNVKLTWEEPNTARFDPLFKSLKEGDFGKIDINQYISSDSDGENSDGEEDEDELELKRKALLGDSTDIDWRNDFDKSKKRKHGEMEMVIKFNPGFHEQGNKILEKDDTEKPKLKKNDKKSKMKVSKEDEWFAEEGLDDEEEEKVDSKKYKDELGLLVDEAEERKGFKLDVEDDRFGAIYKKSEFSIDPTSKYYDPKISGKLLQEQVQRRRKKVKTA